MRRVNINKIFKQLPGELISKGEIVPRKSMHCLKCGAYKRSTKLRLPCSCGGLFIMVAGRNMLSVAQAFADAGFDLSACTSRWYVQPHEHDSQRFQIDGVTISIQFNQIYPKEVFTELILVGFNCPKVDLSSGRTRELTYNKTEPEYKDVLGSIKAKDAEKSLQKILIDWVCDKSLDAMLAVLIFQGVLF